MIVYHSNKAEFSEDVLNDRIEHRILDFFKKNLKRTTSPKEIESWKNSMMYMDRVLSDPDIPDDCGVAIEYQLPQSGKRLDFILTGMGENSKEFAFVIELKQWAEASLSEKDGIINSFVGKSIRELPHPSYQVWSYASLLENFNETVYADKIFLKPCAYLHNYVPDDVISNKHYQAYIEKAPIFLRGETKKLRQFIKTYVRIGDRTQILHRIDRGKIRPSKMLADSISAILKGNPEFVMIDDQKIVYETAMALARKSNPNNKNVLIIRGGPGTGKSVVAINILASITKAGFNALYVSKNAAPRSVYESKLTGTFTKTAIGSLFKGSGAFVETGANSFDTLIVDEAHRLNEKSGLYSNLGVNQIKEIINAANFSVFFIDEDQRVTLNDIGTVQEIRNWARKANVEIYETDLSSQFRCNGSDGYLAWLDNVLQIRETSNLHLDINEYDFRIFSSPNELREAIIDKNKINNRSRLVAGYCWNWNSRKTRSVYDVVISEFDFRMRWNLTTDGSLWIISPESINEIGCIHTCQGLEVDYIGVVVGPDLIVRDGVVLGRPEARASSDRSIRGYKKMITRDPVKAMDTLQRIIKNTYRTLFTRGMKGCYVYFTDKETEQYFRSMI